MMFLSVLMFIYVCRGHRVIELQRKWNSSAESVRKSTFHCRRVFSTRKQTNFKKHYTQVEVVRTQLWTIDKKPAKAKSLKAPHVQNCSNIPYSQGTRCLNNVCRNLPKSIQTKKQYNCFNCFNTNFCSDTVVSEPLQLLVIFSNVELGTTCYLLKCGTGFDVKILTETLNIQLFDCNATDFTQKRLILTTIHSLTHLSSYFQPSSQVQNWFWHENICCDRYKQHIPSRECLKYGTCFYKHMSILDFACYYVQLMITVSNIEHILVRTSDQSTIVWQGILMQILLVAGLKIVLFASKHTVTWTV